MINFITKKYRNVNATAKAAFWFTCANVAQKAIAFLYIPLYTRLVSSEEFGIWSIWQTSFQVLLIIGSFYLYTGVFNNGMIKYESEEERDRFTSAMTGLSSLCTMLLFFLYLLFAPYISEFIGLSDLLIALMFIQVFLTPPLNYWMVRKRFENKYKSVVSVTLGISILIPISALLLMQLIGNNATAITAGYVFGNSVFGLVCFLKTLRRPWKALFSKIDWKYAVKFNAPLLPYYLANIILAQIDRVMIGILCTSSLAGIYSLASQINLALTVVIGGINGAFIPWMYRKLKEKNESVISKAIELVTVVVGLVCLVVVMFGPELLSILGPEEYQVARWVIPPILLGSFAVCFQTLFYNIEMYFAVTKFAALISILVAILKIFSNLCFIPLFGIYAAGWTTLGCYILLAFLHYCVSKRVLIKNNLREVLNPAKLLSCFLGVVFLSLLVMLVYDNLYIRVVAFLAAILVAILLRKNIVAKNSFEKRK